VIGEESVAQGRSKPPKPVKPTEPIITTGEVLTLIPDEYLAAMGRITAAWALLDFHLDLAICHLMQSPQFLGVCLTSQVRGTPDKLTALGALMRAHDMPEARITWLNAFQQKTHDVGRKRNRAVHDAIMLGYKTNTVYRMSATIADKNVAFGVTPSSVQELGEIYQEVRNHLSQFLDFWNEVVAEFQILRGKVPLSFFEFLPPVRR
jgi:hypothetical protein